MPVGASLRPAVLVAVLTAAVPAVPRWVAGQTPGAGGAISDSAALEAQVSALASELRCPVCQGLSIQDSPTELATEMKALIREQLAAGRSAEEVKEYFVDRYGEWVLLQPRPSGFNLVVYALPWLGVLAGAVVIAISVRRWTRANPAQVEGPPTEDDTGP